MPVPTNSEQNGGLMASAVDDTVRIFVYTTTEQNQREPQEGEDPSGLEYVLENIIGITDREKLLVHHLNSQTLVVRELETKIRNMMEYETLEKARLDAHNLVLATKEEELGNIREAIRVLQQTQESDIGACNTNLYYRLTKANEEQLYLLSCLEKLNMKNIELQREVEAARHERPLN